MAYRPPGFQYTPSISPQQSQQSQQPHLQTILQNWDRDHQQQQQQQQQQHGLGQQGGGGQDEYGRISRSQYVQSPPQNAVADEEYNRLLKNYRLAHERIEETRLQMLEQEKRNAELRKHIALLEGGDSASASVVGSHSTGGGGSTVDDFTIKNSSSSLERRINRWAADTVSSFLHSAPPPPPNSNFGPHLALIPLAEALFSDLDNSSESPFLTALHNNGFDYPGLALVVQSLLRHLLSQFLTDGVVNELLVTNEDVANRELTKLHEQLFNREPLVASVWRRQTFSAAVDSLDPAMAISLFQEHLPSLFTLINPSPSELNSGLSSVLEASYTFSRMLHASKSATGGGGLEGSGFYRAYVPELGSTLDPSKLELIKKCYRTERGEPERVGACLFPGLVKVTALDTSPAPTQSLRLGGHQQRPVTKRETRTLVVRRAQVICECALAASPTPVPPPSSTGQPGAATDTNGTA